jgi:LysR family transcriptional regulator for bpeEF and oprC
MAGLGIIRSAELMARDALRQGALVQVLADWHTDPLPLYLMYPQNRHLSAKVRAFADWVAELYQRQRAPVKSEIREMAEHA